jgi:hypothetical protein
MNNHYHLLVETPKANISEGMRHLNGLYTQYVNRRHSRVGHVFQGRFKAILVEKETHLLTLCRYVVQNPVRAGVCRTPLAYAWSSYRYFVRDKAPTFLTTDWILSQFGKTRSRAVKEYALFVNEAQDSMWDQLKGQIYLGGDEFVERLSETDRGKEIPFAQRKPLRPKLVDLLQAPEGWREAHVVYGYRLREIADALSVHYSTVSRWIAQEGKNS